MSKVLLLLALAAGIPSREPRPCDVLSLVVETSGGESAKPEWRVQLQNSSRLAVRVGVPTTGFRWTLERAEANEWITVSEGGVAPGRGSAGSVQPQVEPGRVIARGARAIVGTVAVGREIPKEDVKRTGEYRVVFEQDVEGGQPMKPCTLGAKPALFRVRGSSEP